MQTSESREAARLAALERFGSLLPAEDPALEEITRLVATVCEAPIAVISLLDKDRQHFRAQHGLTLGGTERQHSFCAHHLDGPGLLIVSDTTIDPRFEHNPLVTGEAEIRFYASAPLIVPGGEVIGALCVMDRRPRTLTAVQRQTLEVLSRQVVLHLEGRRRRLDEQIRSSEHLAQTIFEAEPHCVKLLGRECVLYQINRAGLDLIGAPSAEPHLGRSLLPLVVPEDRAAVSAMIDTVLAGEKRTHEFRIRNLHGIEMWLQMVSVPFRIGKTLALSVTRDITEEKRAQEALRRNTELLGVVVNETPDSIYVADRQGRYLLMNPSGLAFARLPLDEVVGRDATAFCPPDQARQIMETDQRIMASGVAETFEETFEFTGPEAGRSRTYLTTKVPRRDDRGEIIGIIGISRDITTRRRSERALEASEARFRSFMAHSPAIWSIIDAEGRIQYASARFACLAGLPPGDHGGRHLAELFGPEQEAEQLRRNAAIIRDQQPAESFVNGLRADGTPGSFLVVSFPISNPDGSCHVGTVALDVTERKQLAERMRRMVESTMHGIFFWKHSGGVTRANDAFLRLIGHSREDVAAGRLNWIELSAPESREADALARQELLANGVCPPYEKYFLHRDGTRVPVLLGATDFQDGTGEGISFVLDLSERKALEQQFHRAQRMESLGTLAGGIAHDLNNILMPIVMSVDLLKQSCLDAPSQELLEVMSTSARRGSDMVRQVLSFARGTGGRRVDVEIGKLIRDIEKIANDTFLKTIAVRIDLAPHLARVMGDPTQIHQLLLNLALNARDAMPSGGSLTISAANQFVTAADVARHPRVRPGLHVMIQLEDTGTGMPPEVVEKIFDPFFTTKEIGKGTGLGLSTALGIARSHQGFLEVTSVPGEGSCFRVFLPALVPEGAKFAHPPRPPQPRGQGQLVLVVDDEKSVRQIARHTLEKHGYRVLEAADGNAALATFAAHAGEIDLVLTDLMMPGMNGRETIRRLREARPDIRVVATTGVSVPGDGSSAEELGAQALLPKPYTISELLECLRAVLEPS